MPPFLWDASALAKRYVSEHGSHTVNALFEAATQTTMVLTLSGYTETYSILHRKYNSGLISAHDYAVAISALRREVVESLNFQLLPTDDLIFASIPIIEHHNLNSTDAVILAAYLSYQSSLPPTEQSCILVASDHRLLRAARAEGLRVIDPEAVTANDISAFFLAS